MLARLRKIRTGELIRRHTESREKRFLRRLVRELDKVTNKKIRALASSSNDPRSIHQLHLAIDNLTNIDILVRRLYQCNGWVGIDPVVSILDRVIDRTRDLLEKKITSTDASEIIGSTLKLLFAAKQKLKQEFGVITFLELDDHEGNAEVELSGGRELHTAIDLQTLQMTIPSTMLYQLRQSLFPPERMIVGAVKKTQNMVKIKALFDVTGEGNAVGVRADPNRLAQALIAMAETGTHFGIWVHSHPGTGPNSTHPSGIDIEQHADWLKDYSSDLVSAIMVKDGYIRFWGTAIESRRINVSFEGEGVAPVSSAERIYRLAS